MLVPKQEESSEEEESEEGEEGEEEEITDDREIKVKIESEKGVRFQKEKRQGRRKLMMIER